jgi:multidrug resistance efflux pump
MVADMKNRYVKVLAVCVLILIALTIISRAADSITVAKVNAETAGRGTLTQRTNVNGEIDASKKYYVRSSMAFRVQEIHVGQGSAVEAGDILFSLDYQHLLDEAQKVSIELSNMRLEIQKMRLDGGSSAAVNSAKAELGRAIADDAFTRSINDGVQMLADKRKIEDAENKLEEARKNSARNDIDVQIRANNMSLKQKEYDEIQKLIQSGGNVIADIRGTVGEIFVAPGETVKGENYCTIIPDDAHFIFIGELSADDARYMRTGDQINIALSGRSKQLTNLTIKSISREEGTARVIVDLPHGTDAYLAQKATLSHEKKSEEYSNIVPLSAIRGTEGDYYIYVVREVSGVLGAQKTAYRVGVSMIEKDNRNAAIAGGFLSDDLIISISNKTISEGDRVRVQSAEIRT